MKISKKLKSIQKKYQLSTYELAGFLKTYPQNVYNWLTEKHYPSKRKLRQIDALLEELTCQDQQEN